MGGTHHSTQSLVTLPDLCLRWSKPCGFPQERGPWREKGGGSCFLGENNTQKTEMCCPRYAQIV